jgi:cytochrome c
MPLRRKDVRGNDNWASYMNRQHLRNAGPITIAIGLLLFASGCKDTDRGPTGVDAYSSFVNEGGDITFPADFPNGYVFIGSWAVDSSDGVADIHSVYTRPVDVSNFKETGKFLDGAVLVKEVSGTLGATHTTGNAFWAHETKTWFLMIKDSKQRYPSNPLWGDGWGWAEFDPATKKQISTNYKADCQGCHIPARQSDWVYAYAYPVLGPKGQANLPKDAVMGDRAEETPVHGGVIAGQDAGSDVAAGKVAFGVTCAACHSVTTGGAGIGPSLAGVVGRKAGTSPGYAYSPAMSNSEVIWTPENIAKHLEKPKELIPENRMGNLFPRGVQDAKQRGDIVAYLQTVR